MNLNYNLLKENSILYILGIIVLIISCGGLFYSVKTIHDDFDGYTINRMQGNEIKGKASSAFDIALGIGNAVELNAQRYQSKDSIITYSLIVKFTGTDWLFIREGEALILLVDDQRMGFSGKGSNEHRNVYRGGVVEEEAWYDINLSDLKKISNAKEVRMKINGSQYYVERQFVEFNFKNFKDFIAKYCQND
jgi:hypothetical protein